MDTILAKIDFSSSAVHDKKIDYDYDYDYDYDGFYPHGTALRLKGTVPGSRTDGSS